MSSANDNIPEGWVETSLGKVASKIIDYRGKTPKKLGGDWDLNGEFRALSAKSVKTGGLINLDKINRVNHILYKKWMKDEIQFNDILLTSEAPMGEVLLWNSDEKIVLSQRLFAIRAKENVSANYLYYYFISKGFQYELNARASGTTVLGIRQTELVKTNVIIPPLPEQKAIANILTAFDDKIENLQAQNNTLEQTAQTIFAAWFGKYQVGDELPDRWRVGKLSDFGEVICGKTPSKSNKKFYGDDIPFIKIPDMHNHTFIISTTDNLSEEGANSQKNKLIPANSICVSCIATVGLVVITSKDSQTNQQINSIIPDFNYLREFLYLKISKMKKHLIDLGSGGTATLNVNTSTFSNIETIIPDEKTLKSFHTVQKPLFEKILSNNIQIQTLKNTRDTLLPKLMSGQLRVNGFKEKILFDEQT